MTISTAISTASYTGNGSTQIFPIPFYFLVDGDIKVSKKVAATGVISTLVLGTDYTLSGAGNQAGGSATMATAPASGDQLFIERNVSAVQETAYPINSPFPSASHEKALDRLTMLVQQLLTTLGFKLGKEPLDEKYDVGGNRVANAADAAESTDLTTLQQVLGLINSATTGVAYFVASGVGAVVRAVLDKLRERPSVVDYGADPTGAADSTAAFNAATAACDDIMVPPGTYKLTDAVSIAKGKRLRGAGRRKTTLLMDSTFNASALGCLVFTGGEPGSTIESLKITQTQPDSTTATVYPPCIYARDTPRFTLRNMRMSCVYAGIDMKGNSGGAVIDDLELSPLSIGIDIDGSLDSVKISKLHLWPFDLTTNQRTSYTAAYGIKSGRCDDLHLSDSILFSMINALYCYNSASGRTFGNIISVDFDDRGGLNIVSNADLSAAGCVFTQGKNDAWLIKMTGGTLNVSASRFRGDIVNSGANGFVDITGGDANFTGCTMQGVGTDKQMFYWGNANVNFSGCRFSRNTNTAFTTSLLRASTGATGTLSGNSFAPLGTGSSLALVVDTDNGVLVRGNHFNGWPLQTPTGALSKTLVDGNLGTGSNKDSFVGYFSGDASTTVKLPSGWSVSRAAAGVYVLTHNLSLAAANDMIPSVNADNTTSGCFAVADASGSTTSTVKIRTYVGTTLTDSGVFFSLRRYRS